MSSQNKSFLQGFTSRLRHIVDARYYGVWAHLAREAAIPSGTFARYIKGEGVPHIEQFIRILEAAKVEPHWLLTGEGPVFRNEAHLTEKLRPAGREQEGYLEAGRIIAALQHRIEELEGEVTRLHSAQTSSKGEDE